MGASKTKMSRKTKKAIRRAVAGVCLVSSIIVAAVPATKTTAYIAPGSDTTGTSYAYGVESGDYTPEEILSSDGVALDLYDVSTHAAKDPSTIIYNVMNVKQLSDGTYNINWQFKGYLQNVNGTPMLVLCEYNSTYQTDDIVINPTMPYEYCVIESATYEAFDKAYKQAEAAQAEYYDIPCAEGNLVNLKARYSMREPAASVNQTMDEYWIQTYFPTEYASHIKNTVEPWQAQVAAYEDYRKRYEEWEAEVDAWNQLTPEQREGKDYPPEPKPVVQDPGPCTELVCYVSKMAQNYKFKYFCKMFPKGSTKWESYFDADDYTLVQVADSRTPATGATINYCYMPKGTPNSNSEDMNSASNNDAQGFLIFNKSYVIAIGAQAFKNTTNVDTLELCKEIKYIGDEAFMDSFVTKVTFTNVENIGNRAFKNCTQLSTIDFQAGAVNIGTEAFYGCGFTNITFPWSVKYIGPGAFAQCTKLTGLHFDNITAKCEIDDYAFFNDVALADVTFYGESTGTNGIYRIGEAAFACTAGVSGMLTAFEFPDNITGMVKRRTGEMANGVGNFVLAGRTNLKTITMPAEYGKAEPVELPYGVFFNCISLECVKFPDVGGACGYVTFGSYNDGERTIFDTIMNKDFYVYGPEKNMSGGIAYPRKSTWGKKSGMGLDVPYVYKDSSGVEQYEISDGYYILIIDENGVLTSCKLVDDDDIKAEVVANGLDLVIPEKVGDTKVTGVATDCFSDETIHDNIRTLKIDNNSIDSIQSAAFKDCKRLVEVNIGNSVTNIGDSAFEGCNKLTQVTFETPAGGYESFPLENIGTKAFATGADSLTFTGDIDQQYGPFKWAMQLDNYVDTKQGTRVCYKTPDPTYLTVIVDNVNGLPTLVDYPHYEQLNALSNTEGKTTYLEENDITIPTTLIDRYENLGTEIFDADGNIIYTYTLSLAEERLVNSVLNLEVPSGIDSIDAFGFINSSSQKFDDSPATGFSSNSTNVSKYLLASDDYPTYKRYGLFNGYYGDGNFNDTNGNELEYDPSSSDASKYEKESIGNDRIQSIKLNTVKYLPANAFQSCERLTAVNLGSELEEIDQAPFAGCSNLTSVGSNSDKYTCYNGILYEKQPDGSYKIIEALSTRGALVGSAKVKVSDEDPLLASVSSINEGAFEDCKYITGVDFRNINKLTEVPDNCFLDCEKLNQVILPENVTSIGHDAFKGTMEGIQVVIYGREVFLANDAFGDRNEQPMSYSVISYSDSAARKAAADIGADVSEVLDDTVKVQFLDYDGRALSNIIYVKVGDSISLEDIPDDPVRKGYKFAGWNKSLKNITVDTIIVATYVQDSKPDDDISGNSTSNSTTDSGSGSGTSNSGSGTSNSGSGTSNSGSGTSNSGSGGGGGNGGNGGSDSTMYTLTVTNGNGSGSYVAGATVIITASVPSGKTFSKWVPGSEDLGIASVSVAATTLTMPAHNATVEATFKNASSNGGSNSNGNSGNGTGNNQSGGTSGNTVLISKPGISNTSLASATVSGSTDNYVIRITETAAATAAVETALKNEYGNLDNVKYSAMDISLYDSTGSTKITDTTGLSITITIPIPDSLTTYAGNNKVAGVVNEKLDKLKPTFTAIDGVPCVTFTATHFSPYTIYVDTGNLTNGTQYDESPKTGDFQPKWFLSIGLFALSMALFFMKDKAPKRKTVTA